MVRLEAEGAADAAQADEGNGADEDDAAAQAVSQRAKHHLPQHGPRQRGHADAGLRPFELMLRVQGVEDILHQVNDEEDVCVRQEADARHKHLQWAGGPGRERGGLRKSAFKRSCQQRKSCHATLAGALG